MFPSPANGMALALSLSPDKVEKWTRRLKEILALWTITRQEAESLIGKLSFSQTSIFGRIGRSMMAPPHGMHNSPQFHPLLPERARRALQWWATAT